MIAKEYIITKWELWEQWELCVLTSQFNIENTK
jgi:hypothetical protein